MALFGKKQSDEPEEGGSVVEAKTQGDPAKAARFFDHARSMHEASNFEYATTLWLQGLRQDPTSIRGLESFYESAQAFASEAKKPGPSKDQVKAFKGKGELEHFLLALLNWGTKKVDTAAGLRALEHGAKLGLDEPVYWVGERVIRGSQNDEKARKEHFVKMKNIFKKLHAFDLAVRAGNMALRLDPQDGDLDAELRNLSAQAAMSKGGYETVEAGSFRANIRDVERQRQLEAEESISGGADAKARIVEAAKEDFESRPDDPAAIMKYAKALQSRGEPEDEKLAIRILLDGYEKTKEFRFREQAGLLQLRRGRRQLRKMKDTVEANPDNEEYRAKFQEAKKKLLDAEMKELALQVEAYPTDLSRRYELGKRYFEAEKYEEAIACFQESQNDAKTRVYSLSYLGRCFLALGWPTEAIETLKTAMEAHSQSKDELGMELRYRLMIALFKRAEETREIEPAEEATRIASGIAMQQIGYREIREYREKIQNLMQELKAEKKSA